LGLSLSRHKRRRRTVTLVYQSDPLIASLIRYTTGATIPNTIAITTTTIIRTVTDIGATTVIGAIGTTTMMIRPKPY